MNDENKFREDNYPVEIDGDLIRIDPNKMSLRISYGFTHNGDQYCAWKDEDGVVTINEIFRRIT